MGTTSLTAHHAWPDALRAPTTSPVALAQQMVTHTQHANEQDIAWLHGALAPWWRGASLREKKRILACLHTALRSDRHALAGYLDRLRHAVAGPAGGIILRRCLEKLVGNSQDAGILEDARRLLTLDELDRWFHVKHPPAPTHRACTLWKTALIYMYLERRACTQTEGDWYDALTCLYPARLPQGVPYPEGVRLIQGETLYMPNAGYVFGGQVIMTPPEDPTQHRSRGIDCSALVCWATYWAYKPPAAGDVVDPSTKHAAMAHAVLTRMAFRETPDASAEALQTTIRAAGDGFMLDAYIPLTNDADLEPGDLVFWRLRTPDDAAYTGGHVAMFVEWANRETQTMQAIEAVRPEDASKEGVLSGILPLHPPHSDTYILRPRYGTPHHKVPVPTAHHEMQE